MSIRDPFKLGDSEPVNPGLPTRLANNLLVHPVEQSSETLADISQMDSILTVPVASSTDDTRTGSLVSLIVIVFACLNPHPSAKIAPQCPLARTVPAGWPGQIWLGAEGLRCPYLQLRTSSPHVELILRFQPPWPSYRQTDRFPLFIPTG